MASEKSPAFQFYPADFLADENVAAMSLTGRGAYITLMCYCWREGSIPADMSRMARLCGIDSSAMAILWPELEPCFKLISIQKDNPGNDIQENSLAIAEPMASHIANSAQPLRYVHPRLDRERQKQQARSSERRESGRRGANQRWNKENEADQADSSAIAKPMAEPIANDSFSSSSSSSKEKKKDMSNSRSTTVPASVSEVFEHWKTTLNHSRAILDSKRQRLIRARLDEGFSPDDLKAAIDGCKASAWHMGENDRHQVYDDLTLILRDAAHVEQFIAKTGNGHGNGRASTTGRETPTHYKDGREKPDGMKGFVC